jgi:hypothetical protein
MTGEPTGSPSSQTARVEDLGDLPHASKVEALAGFGLSADEIARVLQVNHETLEVAFAVELDSGALKANARVAENLYRKATGEGRESVTAAIFWLKTRARWKETSVHEIAAAQQVDLTGWSDERLEAEISKLDARIADMRK